MNNVDTQILLLNLAFYIATYPEYLSLNSRR